MNLSPQVLSRAREKTLTFLQYELKGRPAEIYENAVQEAFYVLYKKELQDSFETEGQLCSWLKIASYWRALKELTHWRKFASIEEIEKESADDDSMLDFERKDLIDKLKSKLSVKQIETLDKILEGFSIGEIGAQLGTKPDTIKHRYQSSISLMKILGGGGGKIKRNNFSQNRAFEVFNNNVFINYDRRFSIYAVTK